MRSLVQTEELKTNLLSKALIERIKPTIMYNKQVGSIMAWFICPINGVVHYGGVVHYLNDNIGLIYEENTKEIIGIRIEGVTDG